MTIIKLTVMDLGAVPSASTISTCIVECFLWGRNRIDMLRKDYKRLITNYVNGKKPSTFASILPMQVERVSLVEEALAASA